MGLSINRLCEQVGHWAMAMGSLHHHWLWRQSRVSHRSNLALYSDALPLVLFSTPTTSYELLQVQLTYNRPSISRYHLKMRRATLESILNTNLKAEIYLSHNWCTWTANCPLQLIKNWSFWWTWSCCGTVNPIELMRYKWLYELMASHIYRPN